MHFDDIILRRMHNQTSLTPVGTVLRDALHNIATFDNIRQNTPSDQLIHVPDVGSEISVAYEQLRNASENIEDHLLFQRAILRFFKRSVDLESLNSQSNIGNELIIELTQAGYLENDSIDKSLAIEIDRLINSLCPTYQALIRHRSAPDKDAARWMLELMSVRTEQLFNHPIRTLSFAYLAHTHLTPLVDIRESLVEGESITEEEYPKILYMTVHKALLKSDDANIRSALIDVYHVPLDNTEEFIKFNQRYDQLTKLKTTAAVARLININGAPLRAIYSIFFKDGSGVKSVSQQNATLRAIEIQLDYDYQQTKKNLRRGITKSIIFLFMTKVFIGLAIEVPYDLIVYDKILVLPLMLNLFAPPALLALNTLAVRLPSATNKKAVVDYISNMLYGNEPPRPLRKKKIDGSGVFSAVYVFIAFIIIGLFSYILYRLDFNIVQGGIFFVFFSTALFLGYRLSLQVRELEIVRQDQGLLTLLRDFVYTPFIYIGRNISYRFSQLNIASQILDTLVELPLKTFLKLVRQWISFLNSRKDDLL